MNGLSVVSRHRGHSTTLLIVLASGSALIGPAAQNGRYRAKPLPTGEAVVLYREVAAQKLAFEKKRLLTAHRASVARRSEGPQTYDEATIQLLGDYFDAVRAGAPANLFQEVANRVAAQLDRDPAPLLRYVGGLIANRSRRVETARKLFDDAYVGTTEAEYPESLRFLIARRCWWTARAMEEDEEVLAPLEARTRKHFVAAAAEAAYDGNERFWLIDMEATWPPDSLPPQYEEFVGALEATEGAQTWIVRLCVGRRAIKRAWKARTGKVAAKVTEEGWDGFYEQLEVAAQNLVRAHRSRPQFPDAAFSMLTVAMGRGDGPFRLRYWLDKTVAAQFDFANAYRRYRYASSPRWGGGYATMLNIGKQCLATERFDTEVPIQWIHALKEVATELRRWPRMLKSKRHYERTNQMLDGLLASEYHRSNQLYWRTFQIGVDYAAGHLDRARERLANLKGAPDTGALLWLGLDAPEVLKELRTTK